MITHTIAETLPKKHEEIIPMGRKHRILLRHMDNGHEVHMQYSVRLFGLLLYWETIKHHVIYYYMTKSMPAHDGKGFSFVPPGANIRQIAVNIYENFLKSVHGTL